MYTKIHGSHLGLVTNYREGGYKTGAGGGGDCEVLLLRKGGRIG